MRLTILVFLSFWGLGYPFGCVDGTVLIISSNYHGILRIKQHLCHNFSG